MSNLEKFLDIISKILLLDIDQINDNQSRKLIEEWDSLSHLVLISEIESTFNITLSDDEVVDMQNIGDLKNIMKNHNVLL